MTADDAFEFCAAPATGNDVIILGFQADGLHHAGDEFLVND
jgi:hypothetical protein